jgi:class 3 adenylate cyclase
MSSKVRSSRKFSLFTLMLIAVSIGTIIYLPLSAILDFNDKFDEIILMKEKRLVQYLKISQSLYKAGADKELTDLLHEILLENDISYIAIYQNKKLTHVWPPEHPLAGGYSYEERAPKAGKDLIGKTLSERSEFLSGDTLLTLGIDKRERQAIWIVAKRYYRVIVEDILIVIGLAALAFWIHTRDLRKLGQEISKFGRVPAGSATKTGSAEAEAIVAGFRGYAASEKELREKSDKLSIQVLPALKREIFSGKEPPYTFECTLVRTDINGFSQIFNSPYRDRFAKHINDFFIGLTEITSRYDGLIYEFVGDEAIFYFKDYDADDHSLDDQLGPSTSINRAIDAIRDIHLLASDIGLRTQLEGHRFTVKSALAHGTLRFGQQVDGFSLSGGVLIETVRILSTVTDKVDSNLYFGSRHTAYLRDDMTTEKVGTFSLKGYSEDVDLVRWTGSTPLSQHLANVTSTTLTGGAFDFVAQHRSDFSLETIISAAAAARESWDLLHHLSLVHALRSLHVYRAHHPLASTLNDWLSAARLLTAQHPEWYRLVSAILMIYPNLVPKTALTTKETSYLETLLESKDPRTVANAIDMLTRYQIESTVRPLTSLFASEHNRVAANALIHEGVRELTVVVLERLEKMIFGKQSDDAKRASGIYALGEIARILRTRDAVYYSTRVDLHRLIQRIEPFTKHQNESVAHQATLAKAKAEIATDESAAAA